MSRRVRALATTLALALVACKPAAEAQGGKTFATLCSQCHGEDAKGYRADNAPSLVSPTFLESATDEQLRRAISEGRPGTSMAAYGKDRGGPLMGDDLAHVVAWIRSHGSVARFIPTRPTGDAERGSAVYAAHCAKCHGTPQTHGSAVYLANPRFLDEASDAFLAYAVANGRPGTQMQAWRGTLTDGQIDDVVAYVRSFAKPPPPAQLPPPTGTEPMVLNPGAPKATFTPRADRFVPAAEVKQALDQGKRIVVLDARSPSDWMRVHIPGAVSVPYYDLKRLDELPNDGTWIIAYCACPHHLSGDLVDAIRKRGIKTSAVLDEGILEWHRRGYQVVAAPGVTPPP